MLPAAHRLRTAADFTHTTREGRRTGRGAVVVYLDRDVVGEGAEAPPRLGVITSKAVGGSVARHRAARRIRGAARSVVPGLPPGTRVVVRALPGADRSGTLGDDVRDGIRRLASGLADS